MSQVLFVATYFTLRPTIYNIDTLNTNLDPHSELNEHVKIIGNVMRIIGTIHGDRFRIALWLPNCR